MLTAIFCAVPFCHHNTSMDVPEGKVACWMCRDHWSLVAAPWRQTFKSMVALDNGERADRAWKHCVEQATTRAAGIDGDFVENPHATQLQIARQTERCASEPG